jgi:rod shape-determining protein MreD
MRRLALSVAAVMAAVVLQLTLVDRLPLPGGGTPDLVLIVVVALGLTGGPVAGMLTGFWAGLALDVAPPASGVLGQHALVFCLVGYGCGHLRGLVGRSAASSLGVAAAAAAAGEMLYVAVGLLLGDPGMTWPAIRSVLPSAVLQDVLISPFVVFGVWKASSLAAGRLAGPGLAAAVGRPQPGTAGKRLARLADGAVMPGSAWLVGDGSWLAGPLRYGRSRKAGPLGSARFAPSAARQRDGWVSSTPPSLPSAPAPVRRGRPPRLRPGAGQPGSAVGAQVRARPSARPVRVRMGKGRRGAAFLRLLPGRRYARAGGSGRSPGGQPAAGRPRRDAVARSVRLHMRGRRGGGLAGGGALRASAGARSGSYRARRQPRHFRRHTGRIEPRFGRREFSFPRRRPRIRGGRPSFLAGRPRRTAGGWAAPRRLRGRGPGSFR